MPTHIHRQIVRVVAASLAAAFLLGLPPQALADNPWDAEQRRLASQAEREARRDTGLLPVLELFRNQSWARPEVTLRELTRLYESRRLPPARRAYVGALLARARLRAGDHDGARRLTEELGYVTSFQVVGPFDNEGKRGFDRELGPEASRMQPFDAGTQYRGKERPVSWRLFPAQVTHFGYVSFDAVLRPTTQVCGFAETFVESERAQALSLWVGNGGATKVYWNGEEVLSDETYRQPDPDRHVALVRARQGWNRVLVKSCVTEATWGFYLRIGDATGAPAEGVRADASQSREVPGPETEARMPRRPPTSVLAGLEAAAEGERARPEALESLARFLALTGADDPAEQRAKQIAARAADAAPTVARLRLAHVLADERGEKQRFATRARELAPNDREAQLLFARMQRGGPSPEDALPVLRRLGEGRDQVAVQALALQAEILAGFDLTASALAVLDRAAELAEGSISLTAERAQLAASAGHLDRAMRLRAEAVELRHDDVSSRRALAVDALRRRDEGAAAAQLEVLATLVADQPSGHVFRSQIYEGLADDDDALEALNRGLTIAPEDASLLAAKGRLLLRLRQDQAAADAFRAALAIRPQDADTRELLADIEPEEERRDERFAAGRRELLERRVSQSGYSVTVLQDLTVNTVFQNGLGSVFRQYAAQAHDDEGARDLRTYAIQYDPDAQRVEVKRARVFRRDGTVLEATQSFEQQLGEPWYRIYYDTRAQVVLFPNIEPGDSIEIQYRIDDVAHRNLFADYYGDLAYLQGFSPIARYDYVLITPRSRDIYFNEPELAGLSHERRRDGAERIDHYFAEDVAALHSEEGMPGMTEVAPYLHVSTYRTWEEVGRWWWGLIQDQLVADDGLKETVAGLVRGASSLEEKVRRIHEWVVRHTRYVALEFGIHGYKPYRVPLIVQRGFGDCKDKASLLYTMFREAGIDARIVLVRTRRNGAIRDLPASLAVFDHAIAYVPELDLYIDGTAEHSGMRELPEMDQGVTVLVVGPEDARLTRTPVLGPDRNRRERELTARLEPDGTATVDVEERIIGSEAPRYRSRYAAAGTREDRFERSLRTIFPGLVLERQTMENLDDLGQPVELSYRARVPQMARRDQRGLVVAPTVLDDLLRNLARNPSRRHPLDLGGTSSYVEDRTVIAPRGYRVADPPDGGTAESEFGKLAVTVEQSGDRISTHTEFELRRDRIAPDDYPAFRRWVEQADAILRQQIHLSEGGAR